MDFSFKFKRIENKNKIVLLFFNSTIYKIYDTIYFTINNDYNYYVIKIHNTVHKIPIRLLVSLNYNKKLYKYNRSKFFLSRKSKTNLFLRGKKFITIRLNEG